jgi:DNA-directed RNA polymerase specialized sigma24 family protein
MYAEPSSDAEVRRLATAIYREKRSYLLAIARRKAVNSADAEEALQEAFIAFIGHFDPARGAPPLAWLTLTLKRQCGAKRLDRYVVQEAERGGGELGFVLESIPSPLTGLEELAVKRARPAAASAASSPTSARRCSSRPPASPTTRSASAAAGATPRSTAASTRVGRHCAEETASCFA